MVLRIGRVLLTGILAVIALVVAPTAFGQVTPVTWCGNDQSAADRTPDAVNGLQVHVIYAFPSDGQDNFAASASGIATDLAAVNAWWSGQDPTRQIRFDMHAFPNCSGFGALDISRVQLPNPASFYQAIDTRLERLAADLSALSFTDEDKKYVVYYASPVDDQGVCGEAQKLRVGTSLIDLRTFAAVFLGACSQMLGAGGNAAITAAHEVIHSLNALAELDPRGNGPNACAGDPGHPCDNPNDLMAPKGAVTQTLSSVVLDGGQDDYYNHPGPWTDVRDSRYLIHLDSPDQAAPTAPKKASATSAGKKVTFSWSKAGDDVGPVRYRVYKNGALVNQMSKRKLRDRGKLKQVIVYGVRAVDGVGRLGPLRTIRFKVGFGIVNAKGKVIKDTVGPTATKRIKFSQTATTVTLRWAKATDTVGKVKGYLVKRNGKKVKFVKGRSITVPQSKAKGRWTVQARDAAGNLAAVVNVLTVS